MNMDNKVIERICVKASLVFQTPATIGSGRDDVADIELLRDGRGELFVPGSSVAGALRSALEERLDSTWEEITSLVFGPRADPRQSLINVYDARLGKGQCPVSFVRDCVMLDPVTRSAVPGAKYDFEVIPPGTGFDLRLEVVLRENHTNQRERILGEASEILKIIEEGSLRLGAKTRRGLGRTAAKDIAVARMDMSNPTDVDKWIDFDWGNLAGRDSLGGTAMPTAPRRDVRLHVGFRIPGSILIRSYSVTPGEADAVHLQWAGKSMIPGTSWGGALAGAMRSIGEQLGASDRVKECVRDLFGFVGEKPRGARPSRIWIEDSEVKGGTTMEYTRNKIDRFTGGVVDGALFTEGPHFGGAVDLELRIEGPQLHEVALVLLAIRDIGAGVQPVGAGARSAVGFSRLRRSCWMASP